MRNGPTPMQQRAVDSYLKQAAEGKNPSKKRAVIEAGYSPVLGNSASRIFKSKGIREALEKYDLTEESFSSYLSGDLKALDARDRLGHLKLLADVLNLRETNLNVYNQKSDEAMTLLASLMGKAKTDIEEETNEPI